MTIQGSITQLKARISAGGDTIQTLSLEVHGDFAELHALLQKPLKITIEAES